MLIPCAEAVVPSTPALARDARFTLTIPAGPIDGALSALSVATGISVGTPGALPRFRAPEISGRMSVSEALRRLLEGTGWKAVRAGPSAWRIEPAPRRPTPATRPAPVQGSEIEPPPTSIPDIVVTGQKRPQPLQDVAMSVSVVSLNDSSTGHLISGSRDLALSVEGLAVTNLGPGRNRQFIRGVADSPFNGPSQSTVAVQLDEARMTFDAPDPDIRLVDMDRVEILKGPQGPLYGSGALGGIYHMVTHKPDLSDFGGTGRIMGEAIEGGSPGLGAEAVLNAPLIKDQLAVRGVGYVARAGGWIDNLGGRKGANVTNTTGGRLAVRWRPDPDWTIDVSGIIQTMNVEDSQYVTISDVSVHRDASIPEPTDNDFKAVATTIQGRIGALSLLSTTSYVDHGVSYVLDSTDASQKFGLVGQSSYLDDSKYNLLNQEIRLSPEGSSAWLAGLSFMHARNHDDGTIRTATEDVAVQTLDRDITEFAAFGEVSVKLRQNVKMTAGARVFRSIAEDEITKRRGGSTDRVTGTFLSPSAALSWTPSDRTIVYLRYASAMRPGGLASTGRTSFRRFHSDDLGTFDLGVRHTNADETVSFAASFFRATWDHIQSDYLLPNGLISTRNAGRGRVLGLEASTAWRPFKGLEISAGGSVLDARLISTEAGLKITDRRLPIAPEASARLATRYDFSLGGWATSVSGQANYIGHSRLTFDDNLDRAMGNYITTTAAAFFTRHGVTIGARIDNIFNVKGDSFAFGNPFSIAEGPQYTPLRPRTFTLSIGRSW